MLKSVCVLFSVLFVAPLAFAEIFKCVGKNGEALYQNFPCQFESMGGTPMDAPGPKKSPADHPVSGPKETTRRARRAAHRHDDRRSQSHLGRANGHHSGGARRGRSLPRSGRTAPLDLCALIVKGAWPPYSSRVSAREDLQRVRQTNEPSGPYRPLRFSNHVEQKYGDFTSYQKLG